MATNGMGVTESIVHAPQSATGPFPYRSGMGMINSAEWLTKMDDFVDLVTTNVPAGWTAAIIDTGATVVQNTTVATGGTGVLLISDATLSEGAAIYMPKALKLTAGKKFYMEMRVRTDDVTDNAVQFGLTDLTATTNPEDLWTTVSANLVAFGILDGSAVPTALVDAGNAGTAAIAGSSSYPMVVDTWHTLAISYDKGVIQCWIDGNLSVTTSTTIPTGVLLSPFVGALNGNGAGANNTFVDYVRYALER